MSQRILTNPNTGKPEKAEVFKSSGIVVSILFGDGTEVKAPSDINKILATNTKPKPSVYKSFRELAKAFN